MSRLLLAAVIGLLSTTTALMPAESKAPIKAKKPAAKVQPGKGCGTAVASSGAIFNSYIARVRPKVENNWYLADGKNHVVLSVTVAADGSVTDLALTSSPTNTQAEQAATDAFNKAQPLESLPTGTGPVRLTMTFDSFADPHGDSNRNLSLRMDAQKTEPPKTDTPPSSGAQ